MLVLNTQLKQEDKGRAVVLFLSLSLYKLQGTDSQHMIGVNYDYV